VERVGSFVVGADHASRAGHFPGKPVVPGVVVLDEVMAVLAGLVPCGVSGLIMGFPGVRFMRPVRFGEVVEVSFGGDAFACSVDGVAVVRGTVMREPVMREPVMREPVMRGTVVGRGA